MQILKAVRPVVFIPSYCACCNALATQLLAGGFKNAMGDAAGVKVCCLLFLF